jgi:type I restriction enzyme S subunit
MQKWPLQPLGKVLRLRRDVVHPRDNPQGPTTFVGLEHIEALTGKRTGMLDIEMSTLTGRKPRFFKGDIVYGYLRPYLNKLWIAEFDGLCSVDQYVYEVDSFVSDSRFVAWFMRSPIYLQRAPIDTTPGQLPRIRTEEVANVLINLPNYDTQKHMADLIDSEMKHALTLRRAVEHQFSAVNKLPSALLRCAFSGGLY